MFDKMHTAKTRHSCSDGGDTVTTYTAETIDIPVQMVVQLSHYFFVCRSRANWAVFGPCHLKHNCYNLHETIYFIN